MKKKVWISTEGEAFEGTAVALCREYGITRRASLANKSGAADRDGVRWMSEDQFNSEGFIKPKLYLGNKVIFSEEWKKNKTTGDKERVVIRYDDAPSETATIYSLLRDARDTGKTGSMSIEEVDTQIRSIESKYEIIDNSITEVDGLERTREEFSALSSRANELNMYKAMVNMYEFSEEQREELLLIEDKMEECSDRLNVLEAEKSRREMVARNAPIKARIAASLQK